MSFLSPWICLFLSFQGTVLYVASVTAFFHSASWFSNFSLFPQGELTRWDRSRLGYDQLMSLNLAPQEEGRQGNQSIKRQRSEGETSWLCCLGQI